MNFGGSLLRCSYVTKLSFKKPINYNISNWSRSKRSYSEAAKSNAAEAKDTGHNVPILTHRLSSFDKRILVWTKKYKSFNDVPDMVSAETFNQAKSKFRIKVNIYMMVATLLICILMIIWGKRDAARGESVVKMNLEWNERMKNKDTSK